MNGIWAWASVVALVTVSPAMGAAIHLKMEMDIGTAKFTPAVTLNENEWVDTEQGEYTLRLRATRLPDESIKVRAEIARFNGTEIDLIGRPTVVTAPDSAAEVMMADESGTTRFRLKITPSLLP